MRSDSPPLLSGTQKTLTSPPLLPTHTILVFLEAEEDEDKEGEEVTAGGGPSCTLAEEWGEGA